SLAACGSSESEDPSAASDGGGTEASTAAEDAPAESTDDTEADDTDSEGAESEDTGAEDDSTSAEDESEGADDESADAAGQEDGTVTITLNGEHTSFTPEIVRCNREPGTIRNAVLTMEHDELPLVNVHPGEIPMLKRDNHGEPQASAATQGPTAEDGEITFDDAPIGDATVDGTVTCLQGNQG